MVLLVVEGAGMVLLDHSGVVETAGVRVEALSETEGAGTSVPTRGTVEAESAGAEEGGVAIGVVVGMSGVAAGVTSGVAAGVATGVTLTEALGLPVAAGGGVALAGGMGTGVLPMGTVRTVEIGVGPQTWQAT